MLGDLIFPTCYSLLTTYKPIVLTVFLRLTDRQFPLSPEAIIFGNFNIT